VAAFAADLGLAFGFMTVLLVTMRLPARKAGARLAAGRWSRCSS
jgi:hypothetical protein